MPACSTACPPKGSSTLPRARLRAASSLPNPARGFKVVDVMTAEGKNTKEIALLLHLSSKTVEGHRRQLMSKLNINSIADLTRYAIREGIASLS